MKRPVDYTKRPARIARDFHGNACLAARFNRSTLRTPTPSSYNHAMVRQNQFAQQRDVAIAPIRAIERL